MKKLLMLSMGIIFSFATYAQRTGYKELQIGNMVDIAYENHYNVKGTKKDKEGYYNEFLISHSSFKICEIPVEYVLVKTNEEEKITFVQVVTKEFVLSDFDEYLSNLKSFSGCVVNAVGEANAVNMNPKKGENISMGWDFKNEQIILVLSEEPMSSFAKDQKRRYSLIWARNEKSKMW